MTMLVVVYDSACGGCSNIAARLSVVLGLPVLARSCRDPHLAAEFPVLAGVVHDRPCRRPVLVRITATGDARAVTGARMLALAARHVRPSRLLAAMGLCCSLVATTLTRTASR
ncbi:hypothetical protein [Actinokineospora sp.]|uniref:hypothetical protein n=1 Tax=Actinokineospora sp. TaxID=1872133 RepID=UPI003D6AE872